MSAFLYYLILRLNRISLTHNKNKILWPMSRESKAYSLLSKTALMARGGPERQSIPKKYARRNTVCVVL